ncbi:unnamed protein product [Phytomonas sp. EM1]|nr:unnamed protein product [Phytomonas sp. EM1]|eukprot:CCW59629.1 unnamed protein product [Phytomonas sp. isolate EM1]
MAFNPILIDDEVGLLDSSRVNRADNGNDRYGNLFASTASGGGAVGTLPSSYAPRDEKLCFPQDITLEEAIRRCEQRYYHEFTWNVPFPQIPDTPLLYYPNDYTELLTNPCPDGVMQSELDAMAEGVLASLPLAYYPVQPEALQEAREAAARTRRHLDDLQRRAQAAGKVAATPWRPEEANTQLDAADAALLATDLDRSLTQQRDMPSLTLIQHPLYTDMGLVPLEERDLARRERIVPRELSQHLSQGGGGAPEGPDGYDAAGLPVAPDAETTRERWREGVQRSFRQARALDQQFDQFIADLAHGKLGLSKEDEEHLQIARTLWRVLFEGTTGAQQWDVWRAICCFSFAYSDAQSSRQAVKDLMGSLERRHLPQFLSSWRPLVRSYIAALEKYVASLGNDNAVRKRQLYFNEAELDPLYTGGFQPELVVGTGLRRKSTVLGENHMPMPIYPIEVIPVFPSGFTRAAQEGISAEKSADGALDFLAEAAETLHHMILPGAAINSAQLNKPHVLVGNTNLLVVEEDLKTESARSAPFLQQNPSRPPASVAQITEGVAISYHASRENTFRLLYNDDVNTSSYLMHLWSHHGKKSADGQSTDAMKGALSKDGKYITYDRIGICSMYAKASNIDMPALGRHVLLFSNEDFNGDEDLSRQVDSLLDMGNSDAHESATLEASSQRISGIKRPPSSTRYDDDDMRHKVARYISESQN